MRKISFRLNGRPVDMVADPEKKLLDVIREEFGLTGTKKGCGKGHCGSCAVLVDKKVVMSCHYPVAKAEGAQVVTIEGLGTPDRPHPIQSAFVQAGAIQCGFCTPGMIIRALALLESQPRPSRAQIVAAFQPHLCRCTGYSKIISAVETAALMLAGKEAQPGQNANDGRVVGKRLPRGDAMAKATGTELYAADLKMAEMLHLKILRSPHAHAWIRSINPAAAANLAGVITVLTAADVPGTNRLKISRADQPVLCDDRVRCVGDPVAVVVAVSEAVAEQALRLIEVTYEPVPAVFHPREAIQSGAPQIHEDHPNLLSKQTILRGNSDTALMRADVVVESTFSTQLVEHAYLEPDAGIAYIDDEGQLVIHAGSQNIHHDRISLAAALGLPKEKVRIRQSPTGGAFGGKLDISVQGVLGLAAMKVRRPVKLVFTREETFQVTTKRHSFSIWCRLGAEKSGKLRSLEMEIYAATGPYASFGKSVMNRAVIHASGPYRFTDITINGYVVYTNGPVSGAMRGFGVPQVTFALESQLDIIADKLGMNPLELRYMNCFRQGDITATGQVLGHEIGMEKCLDTIRAHYQRAIDEASAFNARNKERKRGVGLAGMWFGPGKSKPDESEAHVEMLPDGTVMAWIGAADMGQGSDTVFAQIVAEELGLSVEVVRVVSTDTGTTPDGGYSAGSRQTYISGEAVRRAAALLRTSLLQAAAAGWGEEPGGLHCTGGMVCSQFGEKRRIALAELAPRVSGRFIGRKSADITVLDPRTGGGIPFETYSFGVQMAEVEVDLRSGEVKVLRVTAAHDSGIPINPLNLEGQIEGGIVMGIGYALTEEYVPDQTLNFAKYRIPRAGDAPAIVPLLVEVNRPQGPYGASGAGECPTVPTAPAILNAIYRACGIRIYDLPAVKERLRAALLNHHPLKPVGSPWNPDYLV